jgi:DOMON domain
MKYGIICLFMFAPKGVVFDDQLNKDGMNVRWSILENDINFTMSAPTCGWIAIGLNETSDISHTYFLMGRVRQGIPELVEHYTISPGNYKSFADLGEPVSVTKIKGAETKSSTELSFTIPLIAKSNKARSIDAGKKYFVWLAYSREDDFQHHSMMRTSAEIVFY